MTSSAPRPPTVTDVPPNPRDPATPDDPAKDPGRTPAPQPIDPPSTEPAIELPPDPDRKQTLKGD